MVIQNFVSFSDLLVRENIWANSGGGAYDILDFLFMTSVYNFNNNNVQITSSCFWSYYNISDIEPIIRGKDALVEGRCGESTSDNLMR
eukprot:CAMPEP_0113952912 /NCGR_PEP_ID=MMETSP1339-20121228/90684_1 /TAXON_ID=94617 /ORGANISM="Fibrocapsa japonica" /LENGTH=87 /DNA_ID=CAMNT_0000961589 /DNA_START=1164 /DNA_END=1428 /DNA_ORIENTATION=+ /assembly_acc=CAM_ASM_000762